MAKERNFVHKHAKHFNKSAVFKDRKKASKRGYTKHKGSAQRGLSSLWALTIPTL